MFMNKITVMEYNTWVSKIVFINNLNSLMNTFLEQFSINYDGIIIVKHNSLRISI